MWIVGFLTALAAVIVFSEQKLYASATLNTYYLIMSVIGYYNWLKDSKKTPSNSIHLNPLTKKVMIYSIILLIVGTYLFHLFLNYLGDPMGWLDSFIALLSAIATYWLAKSYISQWWLWVVADILSTILCYHQGMKWMSFLYLIYSLSAIYGYFYWKKNSENYNEIL